MNSIKRYFSVKKYSSVQRYKLSNNLNKYADELEYLKDEIKYNQIKYNNYYNNCGIDLECQYGHSTHRLSLLYLNSIKCIGIDTNSQKIKRASQNYPNYLFYSVNSNWISNTPQFSVIQLNRSSKLLLNNLDNISNLLVDNGDLVLYQDHSKIKNIIPIPFSINHLYSHQKTFFPFKSISYSFWKKMIK